MSMQDTVNGLDSETRAKLEALLARVHAEYQQKARAMLEVLLDTEPYCERREHRLKPESPNDWTAVNGMLGYAAMVLTDTLKKFTRLVVVNDAAARATKEEPLDKLVDRADELVELGMLVQIAAWVVECHFQLIATHDKLPNTADIHADRLRGMVRRLIEHEFAAKTLDETARAFGAHGL